MSIEKQNKKGMDEYFIMKTSGKKEDKQLEIVILAPMTSLPVMKLLKFSVHQKKLSHPTLRHHSLTISYKI